MKGPENPSIDPLIESARRRLASMSNKDPRRQQIEEGIRGLVQVKQDQRDGRLDRATINRKFFEAVMKLGAGGVFDEAD